MKYLLSMLGFGLLLVLVTSLAESSLRSSLETYGANVTIDDDGDGDNGLQKNASCLILCNYCGCDGSFVGDDCICDCGIDGEEHVKCLEKIASIEEQADFDVTDDEDSEAEIQRRFRRAVDQDMMGPAGAGRKLNRKNKKKKVNRRGRGRRFLQMLTSGRNNNRD